MPEVAAALPTVSRDGRTYTFTVRPGFRFSPSSNQPVTALAFQRAIERFLRESSLWTYMADIVGAGAYRARSSAHIAGLTASATSLTIRLIRPSPSLPARIAMPAFCAVPPEADPLRRHQPDHPLLRPYYIASHTPKSELVLRRNPNYHGPRPRRLRRSTIASV